MSGQRHRAREMALQALYEIDSVNHSVEKVLAGLREGSSLPEESTGFAAGLVGGIMENLSDIDEQVKTHAPMWPIAQMAVIDRNILRLAIYEILFDNKVPVKAAINEAVELAKSFGSDNSSRFVNGVLGAVSEVDPR